MDQWYIEHKYHIDLFFYKIHNFIRHNNINLKVSIEHLYNSFTILSYKGSVIPFTAYPIKKYIVKKTWYNEEYDLYLGNELFNIIHDTLVYIQEYNQNLLDNISTHSIENFFEQYFHDTYNKLDNCIDDNDTNQNEE